MKRVTADFEELANAEREAIINRAENEGRQVSEVVLDLTKAGLRGAVHNVNTANVGGPSIQTGGIEGGLYF